MKRYSLISNDERSYRKGLKHFSIGKQQCLKKPHSLTRNISVLEHVPSVLLAARHAKIDYIRFGLIKRNRLLIICTWNKGNQTV